MMQLLTRKLNGTSQWVIMAKCEDLLRQVAFIERRYDYTIKTYSYHYVIGPVPMRFGDDNEVATLKQAKRAIFKKLFMRDGIIDNSVKKDEKIA